MAFHHTYNGEQSKVIVDTIKTFLNENEDKTKQTKV